MPASASSTSPAMAPHPISAESRARLDVAGVVSVFGCRVASLERIDDEVVLRAVGLLHASAAARHSRNDEAKHACGLFFHEAQDVLCGHMALEHIITDHGRVTGAHAFRNADAALEHRS